MGVKNKQRRAAKKRARQRDRPGRGSGHGWDPFLADVSPLVARTYLVQALSEISADGLAAERFAQLLVRPDGPLPPHLVREALGELLADLVTTVIGGGWRPSDLAEIVTRRLSRRHVPALVPLLEQEAARHSASQVVPAWRDDLASVGPGRPFDLAGAPGLQVALELATCLATLPPITVLVPAPGTADVGHRGERAGDPKLLAKVRSLLAKAESTEFDEEADLLSAKAQELISRHALQRALATADAGGAAAEPSARRIWIEPPYVFAKGTLVGAVAEANRCRSVISEGLGFCTVVGQEDDLAGVDVLVTSLLVQASSALLRCGRQIDRSGTSRTRSFRQSFLVAYATRIGERLREATADAVQGTGRSGELVPVLRRSAEQVEAAFASMFPHLVSRSAGIGHAGGWAAGRAAADLALLDTDMQVTAAAG